MEIEAIASQVRNEKGSRTSRKLREEGKLPAVIYGHGEDPEHVTLDKHDVEVALIHGARVVKLNIAGKQDDYLIKEVQYDHLQDHPIHLDLMRFDKTEKVQVEVGIELRGTPKGVSDNGILDQHINEITVECTATNIPETFHPLVEHLELNESLLVKDLDVPEGVTILLDPDEKICTVNEQVEVAETEGEGEEGEDSQQPEVIGRKAKEDEEGGDE